MKSATIFRQRWLRSCLLLNLCTAGYAAQASAEVLDQIAAIVDDDIVMTSELDERIEQMKFSLRNQGQPMPPPAELDKAILDQMIIESLQLQMAERAGVRISDAQLNEAMTRIARQNRMDLDQFRDKLTEQGLSYVAAREQVRREVTIQQVQGGNIRGQVEVSEQEVDNFLASSEGQALLSPAYHLAHIMIPMEQLAGASGERTQSALLARATSEIEQGTSLLEWLDNYNRSTREPLQGGDLGWRKADDLPAVFADVVPPLSTGEVAGPLRSAGGLHLVQLVERRGGAQVIDQTRVRHILIKPSAIRSDQQCEALLKELRQRILAGEDFTDLARHYTEDMASAQEGGDLGWAKKGQFVPMFEQTMAETSINEISEPFKSQFGWHILQVTDRRTYDISKENASEQAYRFLFQRKFQGELEAWLQKIRDEAYIDIKT